MILDQLKPGTEIDGFRVGELVHSGAMGHVFRVTGPDTGFPLIMKAPRIGPNQPAEAIISFETETMILPALSSPHVPRFVAAGDLTHVPYLVIEYLEGTLLKEVLKGGPLPAAEVTRLGAAIADALHTVHQQDTIHLDLKPDNVIVKPDGSAALIDFGFAHNLRYPDLLAEETRFAAGSAPYLSPEQVSGTRSDRRSDIFSLGVVLYEAITGRLPFGAPATRAGLRDRLWFDPVPPMSCASHVPGFLQEIVLRCLEVDADLRYQSAAHVAFDLRHPEQVALTRRATKARQAGVLSQVRRWWNARNVAPAPAGAALHAVPVIMVAVDTTHPEDERHPVLQRATAQILSLSAEFRLICVSVVRSGPAMESDGDNESASAIHLEHQIRLRHWVQPLGLPPQRLSLHVIEASRPGEALLDFARGNHVDMIVLGAPSAGSGFAWWRSVASTVTAHAHCSVHVVRVPEGHASFSDTLAPDADIA